MTTFNKVFDILDLTTLIANELTQHDLALCCIVGYDWYNTFIPHLWHSIPVLPKDFIPKFESPTGRAGLLRNGHHIRVLRSCDLESLDPFVKYGITCTNLVCLDTNWRPSGHRAKGGRSAALIKTGRRGYVGNEQRQYESVETIVISILERNPLLEFLVVLPVLLEDDAVVKVVVECLPELKELYSPLDFKFSWTHYTSFSLYREGSGSGQYPATPGVQGSILSNSTISCQLLQAYPRLRNLRHEALSRLSQEALEGLKFTDRDLNYLEIRGKSPQVTQILMEIPELNSSSELRTLKTIGIWNRLRPYDEIGLEVLTSFDTPWVCDRLELFECKIINIPRPDIAIHPVFHPTLLDPLHPGDQVIPHLATSDQESTAQQVSHTLQRRILQQLGQLTHLRVLRLGSSGRDWDNPHYMRLEMEVSGLDELVGLKELEILDVSQLAHRIGTAEVQWMVENWPKLKSIPGLEYTNHSLEAALQGGNVDDRPEVEKTVPRHVRWVKEQLLTRQ
ncbi:hypothetical protein BGZ96_004913 [Linnemannia gamsii]|uniref:F-box domain-containing protein n=1 Tax=Linnemannia gamsii TaxID=64522 RepID=A0ABQ7K4Y6_9FUNG|nr:hypothetical protein BGZ96_004913 [Linnemannia gamsii]